MSKRIFIIGGARPNFMKIAPLINQFKINNIDYNLIHTGQHYDYNMSKVFFDDLNIPMPDIFLNVGSGSHALQTAKIMIEFEKAIINEKPDLVIVVGDVNSTIACALVAKKLFIDVAHIEASLRSFDMKMPEEINRILTDQISDFLFTTEKSAEKNLKKEGIDKRKIFFVGNIMIDTLITNIEKSKNIAFHKHFNLENCTYAIVTLHRPSNVDNIEDLSKVVDFLNLIGDKIKIIFPIHPRTKNNFETFDLIDKINKKNVIIIDPVGYIEFLSLMINSKFILTDSGGIQEEASFLKIPVLTMRDNTERPITIKKGTNTLIGSDINKLKTNADKILSDSYKKGKNILKWDGKTAERICSVLKKEYL